MEAGLKISSKQFLNHFEESLAAVVLGLMATIAFVNVLSRYFFHYSFSFTEELEVVGFVWITVIGASIGFRQGSQLAVNIFVKMFPKKIRIGLSIFSGILGLILFGVLFYYSLNQIGFEIKYNTRSPSMNWPQYLYTLSIPIGSVLIVFRIVQATLLSIKKELKGEDI